MNEKRFTIINMGLDGRLIKEDGKIIELERVVDLLNENEQSKKRIEHLERKIQRERNSTQKQYEKWEKEAETKIKELSEENEQLRNRINDWHQRTFKAHEYFNILEKVIDEVCNDKISNQIWKEYEKKEKLIE